MPQFLFVKQILQSNNDYQQYQELLCSQKRSRNT